MSDGVEILSLADRDRWLEADALDARPAQTWHYAQALAAPGLAPCLALVSAGGARLRVPFYEREWRGARDIVTWLGLSGASATSESPAPWRLWREFAVERGWVAGYVQLADDAAPPVHPDDVLADGNEAFVLDLATGDPLAGAGEIVRRKIRRAGRDGVREPVDAALLEDAFVRLYPQALQRLGARADYELGEAGLRRLVTLPGACVVGAMHADAVEAVAVFLCAGTRAEYLCNASSERGRDFAAWQIAQGIAHLRARGVRELDLGGGVARGDGLHAFKARFHGRARTIRALHQVYAPERYRALCASAGVESGAWFPAYRGTQPD